MPPAIHDEGVGDVGVDTPLPARDVPQGDIALVLRSHPKTPRTHDREKLDTGSTKANSRVAENLCGKAVGDNAAPDLARPELTWGAALTVLWARDPAGTDRRPS